MTEYSARFTFRCGAATSAESRQCCTDSNTFSFSRLSVVESCGSGYTKLDLVEYEALSEAMMQQPSGCLVIPNVLAAAEVQGSSILVNDVGGAGIARVDRAGDGANRVNAGVCLTSICGDVVGPGV